MTQLAFDVTGAGYREPSVFSYTYPFVPMPDHWPDPIRALTYSQRLHNILVNGAA